MKLTTQRLKQLIKEELQTVLKEYGDEEESWMDRNARLNPAMPDKGSSYREPYDSTRNMRPEQKEEFELRSQIAQNEDYLENYSFNYEPHELDNLERETGKLKEKLRQLYRKHPNLEDEPRFLQEADSNVQQIINNMLGMPEDVVADAIRQYQAQKAKQKNKNK